MYFQNIPQLEQLLSAEGIPVTIGPSPVVCKLCRYFSNLLLKPLEQPQKTGFVREYKRRLLQFYNVDVMDETDTDSQPSSAKADDQSSLLTPQLTHNQHSKKGRVAKRPRKSSRAEDSMSLPSSVESVHEEDAQTIAVNQIDQYDVQHILDNNSVTLLHKPKAAQKGAQQTSSIASLLQKPPQVIVVGEQAGPNKEDLSMLRANPNISMRELFPGEEEMGLQVNVPFGSTHGHRTPEGWTKVVTTMQYDETTRHLWEELQKPYGNQSSFLRHLILLEKYFRNGDLILSSNAGCNAVNYTDSVQHRLQSFDSIRRRSSDTSSTIAIPVAPPATNITLNQMYNLSHNSPITIIPTGTSSSSSKAGKSKPSATETTSLLKQQHYEQAPSTSGRSKRHSIETKTKSNVMPPELICINTTNKQPINMQQSIQQFVAAAAASAAANSSSGVSVSLQPATSAATVAGSATTTSQKPPKSSQNSLLIPQPSTSAGATNKKSSASSGSSTKPSAVPAAAPLASPVVSTPGQPAAAKEQNVIRLPESLTQAERLESKTWRPTLMPVSAGPPALNGQLYQTADGRKLPNLVQVQSGGNPYLISIHDYNRMCILRRERLLRDQMITRNQTGGTSSGAPTSLQQLQLSQQLLMKQYMQQQQQTHHQQQQLQQQQEQQQQNQSKSSTKSAQQPSGSGTNISTSSVNTLSAKVNIPNKILEQNSVIPIPNSSASKSSTLDSLLKVRKSNPTSLLKPNMHIAAKSSQQPNVSAPSASNVANVISITSTPSISSILSAQQQQQQHANNMRMLQSQQLIQQHILEQQLGYQQHATTMPSNSALDAMLKTTQKATDMNRWEWATTLHQKGDTVMTSGSNVVIDNTAAKLLSKIPKSLTVIPQQKHHRKSSGDGNAST